jgi:hypothetical protein
MLDASTSPPKERYAVSKDNIIKLIQPGNVEDQLTEILRHGARSVLAQAVEAEVADFLGKHADLKTADGHQRVVRHGHLPEREVMTGIGPVVVRQPRVRDREADAADPGRIRFSPSISRRMRSIRPPAALHAPVEVDRDAAADPLPEGDLDRRLLRGAGSAARQECCRVVGIRHWPPEGRLARRAHHVAEARSVGEALRLHSTSGPMASISRHASKTKNSASWC